MEQPYLAPESKDADDKLHVAARVTDVIGEAATTVVQAATGLAFEETHVYTFRSGVLATLPLKWSPLSVFHLSRMYESM
jgi:hypothetical protein